MRFKTETAVGVFILSALVIFFYMSYQVGSFRFDRLQYNSYMIYFKDISGLNKKADAKISGVKVGWVDAVELVNDGQQVRATVMINKKYVLYSDAFGIVRQEGLLGGKYLEIIPGSDALPALAPGSVLTKPSHDPVAVDQLMNQFQGIANNVQDITQAIKDAVAGDEGTEKLKRLVDNLSQAAERFSSFSGSVDRIVGRNETNIDSILNDFREAIRQLKDEIPSLSASIKNNIDRVATSFESTAHPVQNIADKIDSGKGVFGQLVNDEDTARDLRVAVGGLKKYFDKVDKLGIVFDIHTETMYSSFQHQNWRDNKAFFDLRIHPTEDYYYIAGIVSTQRGKFLRTETYRRWYQSDCHQLIPEQMNLTDWEKLKFAPNKQKTVEVFDQFLFNLQMAKVYGNIGFRLGLFESTGGVAVDFNIPLSFGDGRWVSSFEFYDMRGRLRLCDDRPHFKWLNRIFFSRTLYFVLGADDYISKDNKNAFFGFGLRFADDDVKYLLTRVLVAT